MELSDEQEELLKQRQKGVLPEIEFPGQIYIVDWKERVLRPKDRLDLKPLKLSEKGRGFYGDSYHFVYDTEIKEWADIDDFDLRPNMVKITIPGGLTLDPVGVAREYGVDERAFVANNPIVPKLVAEVLRPSKREIQRVINKKKWQKPKISNLIKIIRKGRRR